VYRVMAQTSYGQVMWGDLVYLRDGGSPNYVDFWGRELSATKLLKLACLYELFELPDCAVELLLRHEPNLSDLIDVRRALDLLTPPLDGREVSYDEYIATFQRDPYAFYPADRTVIATAARVADADLGGGLRKVVRRVRR
jgi:hypothetical protein